MKTIHVGDVIVSPNRQRQEFDLGKLQELEDSLARGMFHPIVLREEGGHFVLVSGERRLRAVRDMSDLGVKVKHDGEWIDLFHIPYTLLGDLDELAAEEAELDENLKRVDLTWQECAAATARLMDLRKRIAVRDDTEKPSVADIALEVRGSSKGDHQEATRREIILSKHLGDPDVAAAKTRDEAWKIVKRKEETQRNADLAATVGATYSAKAHRAIHGDSLKWMYEQPSNQFDVILTDPPYGMGADEFGDSGGMAAGAHFYKDDYETWLGLISQLAASSFRLAKEQAHAYIFCDFDNFHELRSTMKEAGWNCFRTPLLWHKPQASRAPWPYSGPQRKYECILYAKKGDKNCVALKGDVLTYPADENLGHPAQKPVALYEDLLSRSVRAGDRILDPFCGTGPIFPAAHSFKCYATGIDGDAAAYGIAVQRIEKLI